MLVSFNWYKYSFVFGILKKGFKTAMLSNEHGEKRGRPGQRKTPALSEDTFLSLSRMAINELRPGIRKIAIKHLGKQELLMSIQQLLKPYESLTVAGARGFLVAVNHVIEDESKKYCSIHLNAEDLQLLWHDLR
jgi:hypothetical protein